MSSVVPDNLRGSQRQAEDWRSGYPHPAPRRDGGGLPRGLLLTGLVVAGLGLMAWHYIGPDIRRYIKISNM
jgi:hypothetical protein